MQLHSESTLPLEVASRLSELLDAASKARSNAYCPASEFQVGAALLTMSGEIFSGCNVENASYGLTVCAERNAVGAMAAAAEREVVAVVVVAGRLASPCGACRQVLAEFAGANAPVVLAVGDPPVVEGWATMEELLPLAFRFDRKSD
ncbi:MAG: cytidine deaminase [Fimbriimonadaceae bacterium]